MFMKSKCFDSQIYPEIIKISFTSKALKTFVFRSHSDLQTGFHSNKIIN